MEKRYWVPATQTATKGVSGGPHEALRSLPEPTASVTDLISAFKAIDLTSGLDQRDGLTITSLGNRPRKRLCGACFSCSGGTPRDISPHTDSSTVRYRGTRYRQIEANRRNALKSTGPQTEAGKQLSRSNAVRHGLTAETVIGALEDAEDYKAFEAAVIADYDAQSAVERELVLRLASTLWRLRRATTIETGLFEIQADHLQNYWENRQLLSDSRDVIHTLFRRAEPDPKMKDHKTVDFARCFLRLANLPNFALDRLSRYEATLWRQAGRVLFALDALD